MAQGATSTHKQPRNLVAAAGWWQAGSDSRAPGCPLPTTVPPIQPGQPRRTRRHNASPAWPRGAAPGTGCGSRWGWLGRNVLRPARCCHSGGWRWGKALSIHRCRHGDWHLGPGAVLDGCSEGATLRPQPHAGCNGCWLLSPTSDGCNGCSTPCWMGAMSTGCSALHQMGAMSAGFSATHWVVAMSAGC